MWAERFLVLTSEPGLTGERDTIGRTDLRDGRPLLRAAKLYPPKSLEA